jgi:hypothetical protein
MCVIRRSGSIKNSRSCWESAGRSAVTAVAGMDEVNDEYKHEEQAYQNV